MPYLNQVQIIGHLGKDLETRIAGNTDVSSFSVATTHSYKKQGDSEWTQETEWHNVTLWKPSDYLKEKLVKGATVYVCGRLKTDSYEKDGVKRFTTKIIAEKVMVFPKGEKSDNAEYKPTSDNNAPADDSNSDLPF